jgi:hypothetical protein
MKPQEDLAQVVERLDECTVLLREQLALARDWRIALRNGALTGLGAFLGATLGAALVIAVLRPVLEPIGLERVIQELERPRGDRPPVPQGGARPARQ